MTDQQPANSAVRENDEESQGSPGELLDQLYEMLDRNSSERASILAAIRKAAQDIADHPGATPEPAAMVHAKDNDGFLDANCRCNCDQCETCMNRLWFVPSAEMDGTYIPIMTAEEFMVWIDLMVDKACGCALDTRPGTDLQCSCPAARGQETVQQATQQPERPAAPAQDRPEKSRSGYGRRRAPRDNSVPMRIRELLRERGPLTTDQILEGIRYPGLRASMEGGLRRDPNIVRLEDRRWALREDDVEATNHELSEKEDGQEGDTVEAPINDGGQPVPAGADEVTPEPVAPDPEGERKLIEAARSILTERQGDIHSSTLYLRLLQAGMDRNEPAMRKWRETLADSGEFDRDSGDRWSLTGSAEN